MVGKRPFLQLLLLVVCLFVTTQSFSQDQYCFPFNKPFDMSQFKHIEHLIEVETPVYTAGDLSLPILVVDKESQNPVISFRVTVCEITGPKKVQPFPSKVVESKEGKITLEALPEAKLLLLVHSKGYSTWHSWVTLPLENEELKVELEPSISITGRLIDRETNEPVEGMPVQIKGKIRYLHDEWEKGYITKSNSDGYFEFKDFPKDTYTLSSDWFPETVSEFNFLKGSEEYDYRYKVEFEKAPSFLIYEKMPEYYSTGEVDSIESASGGEQTFGEIKLDAVGSVELALITSDRRPINGFPVALSWINPDKPEEIEVKCRLWTDQEGRVSCPLHCFRPGQVATFMTPDPIIEKYSIPLPEMARKNIQGNQKEKQYQLEKGDGLYMSSTRGRKGTELHRQNLSLPQHPNHFSFMVSSGIKETAEMIYHKTPDDLPLKIQVLDAETDNPIEKYNGFVSLYTGTWVDKVDYDLTELSKRMKNVDPVFDVQNGSGMWEVPDICQHWKRSPLNHLGIAISARGYVRQSFHLPLEKIEASERIVLKMQKSASVKGRLIYTPTKEPLNMELVKRQFSETSSFGRIEISLKRKSKKDRYVPMEEQNQKASEGTVRLNNDGCFELFELPPANDWELSVKMPSLPDYFQEIELHEGVNDLGDILITPAGRLVGNVTDDDGKPLSGAILNFPLVDSGAVFSSKSNDLGEFDVDLSDYPGVDHLLRVIPPWGAAIEGYSTTIYYDTIISVSPFEENIMDFYLPRGNKLTVSILKNEKYMQLKERYSHSYTYKDYEDGTEKTGHSDFNLTKASIVALDSRDDGLVYHQNRERFVDPFIENEDEIKIVFENVPPGKYALYFEGTLFEKEDGYEHRDAPLFYDEFTMSDGEFQLTEEIDGVSIGFELKGAVEIKRDTPLSSIPAIPSVSLERIGPNSTGVHHIMIGGYRSLNVDPKDAIVPVFHYELSFWNYKDGESLRSPVVPVGRYLVTIKANDLINHEDWVVDQYEIEVKPGDGDKKFEIQCPLPRKKE